MDLANDIKRAGDADTATDLYNTLLDVQNAIGATSATQGLRDTDIPGPVPNRAFDAMAYLQAVPWRTYIPSGLAGGFPITTIFWPVTGSLLYVMHQTDYAPSHMLVIGKNGKVAFVQQTVAGSSTYPGLIAVGVDGVRGKDILTINNYTAGTALPVVGDPLGEDRWEAQCDYTLLFLPSDE